MNKSVFNGYQTISSTELMNISGGKKHPVRKWLWHYVGDPVVSFGKGIVSAFG
ncbi:Protein of unknown function [Leuconostoc citreum LBAE C10]|uniref:hypothetical protein n=1 Tax=Leuconostoc citreum TaxID=33964 RepID=UPI0002466206|nr:hypothetical protein [Leuconostoc citreum]CCF25539.1 Protein of unknown function [Leuconostoc citreum LBAE C10]